MRHVIKRDNSREPLNFEQVTSRIRELCEKPWPLTNVKYDLVAQHTIAGIYDGISTSELDRNAASNAQNMAHIHPEYGILASRLCVDCHRKDALHLLAKNFKQSTAEIRKGLFYYVCRALYENVTPTGQQSPLISPELYAIATKYRERIEEILQYDRDFIYDYMGFTFLQEKYLLRTSFDGQTRVVVSWPQHMFMRVAIGIQLPCPPRGVIVNDDEVLQAIPQLKDILLPATLRSPIDWEHVLVVLRTKVPCTNKKGHPVYQCRKRLKEILNAHNRSWNDRYLDCMREPYGVDWDAIEETYKLLSLRFVSQATPTYYNAGTLRPQLASCFLIMNPDDSLDGISRLWVEAAEISKVAGGVGSHHHNIRARNSYIRSTNGHSNGLSTMLRVLNTISEYVDQGGQKRPGSHAIYIEPWHADILDVVNLKRALGNEHERARQLFYAIWIPDEFIRCLREEYDIIKRKEQPKELWYLMCPAESADLSNYYDEDFVTEYVPDAELYSHQLAFTRKYRKLISSGRYRKRVSAISLWKQILEVIIETGVPYMMFKDSVNRKSNQKHLGTIKSSNLCTEIVQFSNPEEIAVCNLMSICLPSFVHHMASNVQTFEEVSNNINWDALEYAIGVIVRNMNECIDHSYYPNEKAYASNMRHRPLSIGVQGLADMCVLLGIEFDGELAIQLNYYLFEFIYYHAVRASCNLAKERGAYKSFQGSPLSQGVFHHELWEREQGKLPYPLRMPWDSLRKEVMEFGTLNSQFVGLMPTSSTSDINGLSACFEPYPGMVFKRRRDNIEVQKVNPYLADVLNRVGLWNQDVQDRIFSSRLASIQEIEEIPQEIRRLFKTAWDIPWKKYNALAIARSPFIDQSQSLSQFIVTPTIRVLTELHYYNWRNGAKTSSYYTRRLPPVDAQKLQVRADLNEPVCKPGCDSCGA